MLVFTRRAISVGLIAGLIGPAQSVVCAQQPATISVTAEPTCRTCAIELTRVVTLGRATDSVLLGQVVGVVAVNSRGEYFAPASAGFQVAVYDSLGRLTRAIGKRGPGPGEFRTISDIRVGTGDSLLVADSRNNLQLFTADLRYGRTIRIPNPSRLLPGTRQGAGRRVSHEMLRA